MAAEPSPERVAQAEAFLQEAVFRSRERQAVGVSLMRERPDGSSPANCGLGRDAVVALDLSPRARELFAELWPAPPADAGLERVRDALAAWVERQDALDRERNHFLRDFRKQNGSDRTAYDDAQRSAYEAGLDEVNARETAERRAAARRLLA